MDRPRALNESTRPGNYTDLVVAFWFPPETGDLDRGRGAFAARPRRRGFNSWKDPRPGPGSGTPDAIPRLLHFSYHPGGGGGGSPQLSPHSAAVPRGAWRDAPGRAIARRGQLDAGIRGDLYARGRFREYPAVILWLHVSPRRNFFSALSCVM